GVLKQIWPKGARAPLVFTRVAPEGDALSSLHAKLLVCDTASALVTSANFTRLGMHENIEIGVMVRGNSVSALHEFILALITSEYVAQIEW
ncbi:MAG: phospholipase D-like domain-containing protein, partial [Thermomicrobiales bacterium]